MYDLQARARRTKSGVYVQLAGLLANSCMQASIRGTYPGSIVHIVDPGHAEIFINEEKRPGSVICLQHLVPWHEHVMLPDFSHKQVAVLVNGKQELLADIEEAKGATDAEKVWVVTALVGAPKEGPFLDCAIHHQDDIILAIYRRVFGPDTRAACDAFRGKSCTALTK
jgi:hypothetical protein